MAHLALDAAKLSAAWLVITASAVLWLHCQTVLERSARNSLILGLRVCVVLAAVYAIFCLSFGMPIDVILGMTAVVLMLTPLAHFDGMHGDSPFAAAVWILLLLPSYILKQFVLGFPDRDRVILSPPPPAPLSTGVEAVAEGEAQIGCVVSTLRPSGKIEIDGSMYDATTFDGKLLETGAGVKVCGTRGSLLIVRALQDA